MIANRKSIVRGKRRSQLARSLAFAALLSTTACAPIWSPINEKTPRPFDMPTHQMSMNMPTGWMSSTYGPLAGHFFFTVHGAELEQVWIRRFPKSQEVKGTGRSISEDMTVQDIANLSLDSRRLDNGTGAFELVSNRPAKIDGRDCFRLDYRHRTDIGLELRVIEYGCPVGSWLYRFEFMAPRQHYFERYLADFETMASTIKFAVPGA